MLRSLSLFISLSAVLCCSAHADLIGDVITIERRYPDPDTVVLGSSAVVQVQAGTADVPMISAAFTVNPEANTIFVDFLEFNSFSDAAFNGLVIRGINDTITGVSVSTNLALWDDSRIWFDDHSIFSNWQDLSFNESSYFNITLSTGSVSVPDEGMTASLLVLAMARIGRGASGLVESQAGVGFSIPTVRRKVRLEKAGERSLN